MSNLSILNNCWVKNPTYLQIKSVLDTAGVEEMTIGAFTVRFTNVVRNNFNTTAFKNKYLELYNAFIKQSNYRKFSIV